MPSDTPVALDAAIRPLTFLQTLRAASRLSGLNAVQPGQLAGGCAMPRWLKPVLGPGRVGAALYYHLATSGFSALVGEQVVGWLFLRGWRQVLYVEGLRVQPDWAGGSVEQTLLQFAEQQGRELNRRWLGATLAEPTGSLLEWFDRLGYRRGPWRMLVHTNAAMPGDPSVLRRLEGRQAAQARARFAMQDIRVGEGLDEDELSHFLITRAAGTEGQSWHVVDQGEPVAYLHASRSPSGVNAYLAAGPASWGSAPVMAGLWAAVEAARLPGETPCGLRLRLASSGHHVAVREPFAALGFEERTAALVRVYKPLHEGGSPPA